MHQDCRAPEGREVRGPGLRNPSAILLCALFATSVLAAPDAETAAPAQPLSPVSIQAPAPPGLYPYALVPFFPFLWPASPTQPQPYPFVIWLPFKPTAPPAPANAQPVAPPQPEVASPQPPVPPAAGQESPTAHTPTPATQPEAAPAQAAPPPLVVESPPAAAEPPKAAAPPAEPPRPGAAAPKPPRAKHTASQRPTPTVRPAKRKLCWREGRLDVCK